MPDTGAGPPSGDADVADIEHPCVIRYSPSVMADELEQVTQDVTRYRDASLNLVAALGRQEETIEQSLRALGTPLPLDVHMRNARSADVRRDVSDRLQEFETARKDIRISLTTILLAQGRSVV